MYIAGTKLRAEGSEEEFVIEGYFAVYDKPTLLWEGMYESISKGAFDKSLENNDIRCLFNHEAAMVLGRTGKSTLQLTSDDTGLYGKVFINQEDDEAMNIYQRVKRGDIDGCSFGFMPIIETPEPYKDGVLYRVEEADTMEVSIVTFPQYPETEIQARSKQLEIEQKKQLEVRRQQILNKLKGN